MGPPCFRRLHLFARWAKERGLWQGHPFGGMAEMAEGALAASDAALAVSITGIAGPSGGSAEKPVGTVWFGLAQAGRPTLTRREQFGEIGRDAVRRKSVETALTLLRDALD